MLKGSCLCGAVSYEADVESPQSMQCFCRHCQKSTGSQSAVFFVAPDAQFQLTGSPKSYVATAESGGTVERFFCGECGSQLFSQVSAMPGASFVKLGSLDDPSAVAPQANIWTKSKPSWALVGEDTPCFEANPQG